MPRGVSLLEVLFAILVTTIGLFGALALLPVASSQARKGRINDALGAAATRCIHEFDARGMRRVVIQPGSAGGWMAWNPAANNGAGEFQQYAPTFGESYCIDPRLVAENGGTTARATAYSTFPYTATTTGAPRMRRITLWSGRYNTAAVPPQPLPMAELQADSLFFIDDDLTYDRPETDRSLQPTQTYEFLPGASTFRSRRLTDGHMSWMATLVPKLERYSGTGTDTYVLSIVMFYDRPANLGYDEAASPLTYPNFLHPLNERTLTIPATMANPMQGMPGLGIMGGEVLLRGSEAALNIKSGDWIMLAGKSRHLVNLSGTTPRYIPVFKWYRVSDTEAEATDDDNDGTWERYVTLMGPDWNVPLIETDTSASTAGQALTEAVVVEGVVGVYEKTIRLE